MQFFLITDRECLCKKNAKASDLHRAIQRTWYFKDAD